MFVETGFVILIFPAGGGVLFRTASGAAAGVFVRCVGGATVSVCVTVAGVTCVSDVVDSPL